MFSEWFKNNIKHQLTWSCAMSFIKHLRYGPAMRNFKYNMNGSIKNKLD